MSELFFALWFFIPAGIANVCAFASGKIPFMKPFTYPADFNLRVGSKRILGSHKTLRGFIFGTLAAIIGVYLQVYLYNLFGWIRELSLIDYNSINPVYLGFLLGFGALLGDAVKSFFKRRQGLQPGRSWVPFDQIDYIVGGIVLSYLYIPLSWLEYSLITVLWLVIHPAVSYIGYILKLKRKAI